VALEIRFPLADPLLGQRHQVADDLLEEVAALAGAVEGAVAALGFDVWGGGIGDVSEEEEEEEEKRKY
jgi:hypothetical protein